jgi:hypothetical protein
MFSSRSLRIHVCKCLKLSGMFRKFVCKHSEELLPVYKTEVKIFCRHRQAV